MYQYYWAQYLITDDTVDYLIALWELALDLHCWFWRQGIWTENNPPYEIIIIKTPSYHMCTILNDEFGKKLNLSGWQPLVGEAVKTYEEDLFQQAGRIRFSQLSGNLQSNLCGGYFEMVYMNERRQSRL